MTENLVEMNPDDVVGTWLQENAESKTADEDFVKGFTIVIANELLDQQLHTLSIICNKHNIKLVAI